MFPTCHSQQHVPEGASTEGLVSVICCGFTSATPGFSISEIKHESLEAYDCAVLEQKARTVTRVKV